MTREQPKAKGTVRWVGQDVRTGLPQKRRQAVKACSTCRKSKKRCPHVPMPVGGGGREDTSSLSITFARTAPPRGSTLSPEASSPPLTSHIDPSPRHASLDADASVAASQLLRIHEQGQADGSGPSTAMSEGDARDKAAPFLGELNPEGIFVEATLTNNAIIISPDKDVITSPGIWVDGSAQSRPTSQNTVPSHIASSSVESVKGRKVGKGLTVTADNLESFAFLSQQFIVSERGALVRATDEAWEAIKKIYLHKINPMLPIFDEAILGAPRNSSLIRSLVEASVCLAVAADSEAEPYLILQKKHRASGTIRRSVRVLYQEYSQAVVNFIQIGVVELRTSEPQEHVLDCVSILALTSFFWQPGPHARFSPMDLFGMLASMVHTYGIHLMGAAGARAPFRTNDSKRPSRLFRCLYAIDRLISAFYARPVMFHNYDVLISLKPHEGDTPSFKLFMSLTTHLDQIIELYRPRPTIQQSDIDFPIFERLIMEAGAQQEPDHILGTLEVLYHAISILSVRMPRSKFRSPYELDELLGCVSYSHLPPNRANARRSLSADRIVETIRDYKLSPMPFVPYALALSLSVQYRKWRFSRTPMFRARAKTAFEKIVPILDGLGKVWTSARITSNLGAEVIKQLSKSEESGGSRSSDQRDQMDLDIPQELQAQTNAPATITTVTSPPTDLPTPATSTADKGKSPAIARSPYAISTLIDSSGPSTTVTGTQQQASTQAHPDQHPQAQAPSASHTNLPQEQADGELPGSNGFSSMLGGMEDDGLLAGFDWTLANTLDPCYYASSYYWAPFQGGVVDEAGPVGGSQGNPTENGGVEAG